MNLDEYLCEAIDKWYIQEKKKLKGSGPHKLGIEKENLKLKLCGLISDIEITFSVRKIQYYVDNLKETRGIK